MLAVSIAVLIVSLGALALASMTLQAARTERAAARAELRERADDRAKLLEGIAGDREQLLKVIQEQAAQIMYLSNHPWQTPPMFQVPDTPDREDAERAQREARGVGVDTLVDEDDLPALSAFEA